MSDTQSVRYQPIPNNKLMTRMLTQWSAADVAVLALGVLATLAFALLGDLFWVIFFSVTTIVLLIRLRNGFGRMHYEVYLELLGFYIEKFLDGVLWQAEEETRPLVRFLRSRWRAIPMRLTQVKAVIDGRTERFGLLEQLDRPYDYLFIKADGGEFSNLDINDDTEAVNTLAHVTNVAILETELKAGTSYLRIETPFDQAELKAETRQVVSPPIARPESFGNVDPTRIKWYDWARNDLDEIDGVMRLYRVAKPCYLIVVSIKRKRSMNRRGRTFTDNQLRDLPIIDLGRSLVEALGNESTLGLTNVHCLGLAELATVVRTAWDVAGIDKYNIDKSAGLIPSSDDQIEEFLKENGVEKLNTYLRAWPERIVRVFGKDKVVQMDDNFLSTSRAISLPERIRSDQARKLQYLTFRHNTWLRRASVGQSASGTTQTSQLVIAESAAANLQGFMTSGQIVHHPKHAKRRREIQEQAQETSSQSVLQRWNYFWTTVGVNLEEIIRSRKASNARLQSELFGAKVIGHTALQVDVALSGILGINRL